MNTSKSAENIVAYTLGILLAFLALNAFGGGYYGLAGAKNVPIEWLEGSPFQSYFVPSLILFFIVGGSALTASIAMFKRHPKARTAAFICGIIVLLWLAVQVWTIGYVSWMQPVTACATIIIFFLTWLLPNHKSPDRR